VIVNRTVQYYREELHRLRGELEVLQNTSTNPGSGDFDRVSETSQDCTEDEVFIVILLSFAVVACGLICCLVVALRQVRRFWRCDQTHEKYAAEPIGPVEVVPVSKLGTQGPTPQKCWIEEPAAALEAENRIVTLGQELLEQAIQASLWPESEAEDLKELRAWAASHAEVTPEMVLEAALKRIDLHVALEKQLRFQLEESTGTVAQIQEEQRYVHEGNLELERKLAETLESSNTTLATALRAQVEELQRQLQEVCLERDAVAHHKAALERRAADGQKLEAKLSDLAEEYATTRGKLEQQVAGALAQNGEMSARLKELQSALEQAEAVAFSPGPPPRWEEEQRELRQQLQLLHQDHQAKLHAAIVERQEHGKVRAELENRVAYYAGLAESLSRGGSRGPGDFLDAWSTLPLRVQGDAIASPGHQTSTPTRAVLPSSAGKLPAKSPFPSAETLLAEALVQATPPRTAAPTPPRTAAHLSLPARAEATPPRTTVDLVQQVGNNSSSSSSSAPPPKSSGLTGGWPQASTLPQEAASPPQEPMFQPHEAVSSSLTAAPVFRSIAAARAPNP